jgi:hypothetical protein
VTRAIAMMWVMVAAMRLAGSKEGKGEGGKGYCNSNVRVAGKEEGKGSKVMALATGIASKWTATATKRAMAMATRVAGEQWQR